MQSVNEEGILETLSTRYLDITDVVTLHICILVVQVMPHQDFGNYV